MAQRRSFNRYLVAFLLLPLLAGCKNSFTLAASLTGQTPSSSISGPTAAFAVGVNLSGLEQGSTVPGVAGTNYQVPTTAELDYYKTRGMLKLRLPIMWERLQITPDGALDATYLGYITTLLDQANARGMTLILDLHNYAKRSEGNIGSVAVPVSAFVDVWTKLATVVKNNGGLGGYDLMNEPVNVAASDWKDMAQLAITGIRAVDMNHVIYVMGGSWGGAWNFVDTNPTLHLITDPANNLIFEAHVYFDRDSSGNNYVWADEVLAGSSAPGSIALDTNVGVNRISGFVSWLQLHGFRGQIGEVGVGRDNIGWLTALDKMMAVAQTNKLEVQYWAGGPGWGTSYPYAIEFGSDVNLQASQMAVLSKYTSAVQPTAFILTAPTARGTVGAASPSFALLYRGYLASALTITPSDSGGGGTFTPSSITLPAAFNGAATFTYTPAVDGTFTITATAPGGYAPLAPVGYTTLTDAFKTTMSSPKNIYSLRRASVSYVGPLIRLQRSSDSAQNDFYALNSGSLDTASITTWAGGSSLKVIKWYDQSSNGNDMRPVFAEDSNAYPTTSADYPNFTVNDTDGKPSIVFDGTKRMDASSPLTNITQQSILVVAWHTGGSYLISAAKNSVDAWPGDDPASWNLNSNGGTSDYLNLGLDNTAFRAYESSWQGGVSNDWTTYKNGVIVTTQTSAKTTFSIEYNRNVFNFGYRVTSSTASWQGKVREISVLSNALTSGNVTTLDGEMRAAWGL